MAKKSIKKKRAVVIKRKGFTEGRRLPFVHAYLNNQNNATQAAILIGVSPQSAAVIGHRLLKDVKTQELLNIEREVRASASGLTVERTLKELSRLAYSNPKKLFDANGNLIPIHLLDDDTAATISGFEVTEEQTTTTKGKRSTVASLVRSTKPKLWDKNSALEKAMKYHKLYSDDVPQHGTVIIIGASALDEDI